MRKILLYIVVFICGGAVLAIEILGTRMIGPFYGVSLFLWSALISITLTALSAGYMIGGRLADRIKSHNILAIIIFLSGIITILLPLLRDSVISFTSQMELRTAVLLSSFMLFFPPLTLLGMVSPYAIKLRTETLEKVGSNAGDLYAVSTIGSVFAALLTGFILIPNFGVIKLTLAIGIILIVTSITVMLPGRKPAEKISAATLILVIILAASFLIKGEGADPSRGIVHISQSPYGELRVVDIEDDRLLLIDGGIHSAINRHNGENLLPYAWVLDIVKSFRETPGDLLLIGLGGGSVVKSFYEDNWDIEVVEIDPAVTKIAYDYFNLDANSTIVHHRDGREFLSSVDRSYDLIILDAFGSSSVPFHLTTKEAFRLTKSRLNSAGVLAVNMESIGWDDIIIKSIAATLRQVFNNVIILPIAEPPDRLGNIIITASDESLEPVKELERNYTDPDYRFSANYERAHAWDNRIIPESQDAQILTDDMNPVEIWSERINFRARNELHLLLGERSFLW